MRPVNIGVLGLGYVGLPLAVALAEHFPVTGYDISERRIEELRSGVDRTGEIDGERLSASRLTVTHDRDDLAACSLYIVTVPTPVDQYNNPDLQPLRDACAVIADYLRPNDVVVLESTVYPGVTEQVFGVELARASGLACGTDFFLGYSPERINPGDREHTIGTVTKVVAGQTPEVLELLSQVYGRVTSGNVFRAASIKAAEAAKVIENTQRDINIAFVNELARLFGAMDLSVYDVLDAASTKWNFLRFVPGLVGGHCIGVDPFYLAECAADNGYRPELVLAGRRINETMAEHIADRLAARLQAKVPAGTPGRILVLGLTFKENVPDTRNSKVVDLVRRLRSHGHVVRVHDPYADPDDAVRIYGDALLPSLEAEQKFDCLVVAVGHQTYLESGPAGLTGLLSPNGLFADIKGLWRSRRPPSPIEYWTL